MCGRYAVCLFFFLSGYGLMLQYQHKGISMFDGYLRKRFSKLAIPIIVAVVVFSVFRYMRNGEVYVPHSLTDLEWLVPYSWFVYELAVMYLLFYGIFRFFSPGRALLILGALVLVGMMGISGTNLNSHWWLSSLSFPAGCAIAYYEKPLCKYRNIVLLPAIGGVVLRTVLVRCGGVNLQWLYALVSVPTFLILAWLCLPYVRVRSNGALSRIGCVSYEVYLYQGLAFAVLSPLLPYSCGYSCALLILLLAIGWVMHRFAAVIVSRVQR